MNAQIVYILMETIREDDDSVVAVFTKREQAEAYAEYLIENKHHHKDKLWITSRDFNPKGD